jgi:hypothetical protein
MSQAAPLAVQPPSYVPNHIQYIYSVHKMYQLCLNLTCTAPYRVCTGQIMLANLPDATMSKVTDNAMDDIQQTNKAELAKSCLRSRSKEHGKPREAPQQPAIGYPRYQQRQRNGHPCGPKRHIKTRRRWTSTFAVSEMPIA